MAKGDIHASVETGEEWGVSRRPLPGPELRALVKAALDLCPTEPTFDDVRLSYVEIQVQRADLAAFNAAVAAYRKARGGDRGE